MKGKIIAIILLCNGLAVFAENKIDYAEYYGVELPAKPAEKPPEVQSESPSEDIVVPGFKKEPENNISYIRVKNEYPESMKICFENAFDKLEIYLSAYEENTKVPIDTKFDYKVKVFNIYNQYLGYISKPNIKSGLVKISPFLLLQEIPKKIVDTPPPVKEVVLPETTTEPKLFDSNMKNEFEAVEKQNKNLKHPIKVANLSKVSVHLNIFDSKYAPIGSGWTITPEVSEPEFLKFKQERIEIAEDALLEISPVGDSSLKLNKKTQELDLDSQGNYLWLIKP